MIGECIGKVNPKYLKKKKKEKEKWKQCKHSKQSHRSDFISVENYYL